MGRFEVGDGRVPVLVEDLQRANRAGWARVAQVFVQEVDGGRCVYAINEHGTRNLVALLSPALSGDPGALAQVAESQPVPSDYRLVPRSELGGVRQVAERLGVSEAGVRKWRQRHKDFPAPIEVGGQAVFDLRDVETWARLRGRQRAP